MGFEQPNFEESKKDSQEEIEVDLPAKKKPGFFKKAVTMAAMGATLMGGEVRGAESVDKIPDNSPKVSEKIAGNSEKLTGSALWAVQIVEKAKGMTGEIKSKEDALTFIRNAYGAFVMRFQNPDPTKGDSVRGNKPKYIEWDRVGTAEDFRAIGERANELVKIFQEVSGGNGIHPVNIQNELGMLREIARKCGDKAGQQQTPQPDKFKF